MKQAILLLALAFGCAAQSPYGQRGHCRIVYDFAAGTTGTVTLPGCQIPANSTVFQVQINIGPPVNPLVVNPTLPSGTPQSSSAPVTVSAGFATVSPTALFPVTAAPALQRVYPFTSPNNPAIDTTLPVNPSTPASWILLSQADSPTVTIAGGTIDAGRLVMTIRWVTNLCTTCQ